MNRSFGKTTLQRVKRGLSKVNPLIHRRKTLTHKVATKPLKRALDSEEYSNSKRRALNQ